MSIKAYVTTDDLAAAGSVKIDDREILATLGSESENIAFQLEEVFAAVKESVVGSLEAETQLTIEITGSISLKADAGVKYLFFNVGGGTEKASTMKVLLSTTLRPGS